LSPLCNHLRNLKIKILLSFTRKPCDSSRGGMVKGEPPIVFGERE